MSTTSWLDRNSQTPSVATTKNECSGVSSTMLTSGWGVTPIDSATVQTQEGTTQHFGVDHDFLADGAASRTEPSALPIAQHEGRRK